MKKLKLLCVLIAAAFFLTSCFSDRTAQTSVSGSVRDVIRGNLLIGLTSDGRITLPVTALNFEVSGRIGAIYASPGDDVKKGDILAELDDSDLQIAIATAQINLAKAQAIYNDALSASNLNIQTESVNLESLYRQYDAKFDDQAHQQAIAAAQTNLQRKEHDLNAAITALNAALSASLTSFDSFSYDIAVASAQTALDRRNDDLKAAKQASEKAQTDYQSFIDGNYQDYNIQIMETTLSRILDDLDKAKMDLENALSGAPKLYDSFSDDAAIQSAQTNLQRKEQELQSAQNELNNAKSAVPQNFDGFTYNLTIQSAQTNLQRRQQELHDAQNELNAARWAVPRAFDGFTYNLAIQSAQTNYDRKYSDYYAAVSASERALSDYLLDPSDATMQAYENSMTAVTVASHALEDAQTALFNAQESYKRAEQDHYLLENQQITVAINAAQAKVNAAQIAYDDAQTALANAQSSNSRAGQDHYLLENQQITVAINAAQAKVNAAQIAYDDARTAFINAQDKNRHSEQSHYSSENEQLAAAVENAQSKVNLAQTVYDDAQTALNKALSDLNGNLLKNIENAQNHLQSAQNAFDDAQFALNKANDDLLRAKLNHASSGSAQLDQNAELASAQYTAAQNAHADAFTALQNAHAALNSARATHQQDKDNTYNSIQLLEVKIENMTGSTSAVDNAYYNLQDAENQVKIAENELEKIKVVAPIDGKILDVTKKIGEVVSGEASSSGMGSLSAGSAFITLCDTSEIFLKTNITESDIASVEVGQTVRVRVDALENAEIYAKVVSVSSIPNVDSSGIITYEAVGRLDEINNDIKDNMSLFLTFIKIERQDVLMVPNRAVFAEDGQQYVHVAINGDANNLEKRPVICGLSNGTQTEVMEGLEEGEAVIIRGVSLS